MDSSYLLFGTIVVVMSLVPVIDRAAHYSTASLKAYNFPLVLQFGYKSSLLRVVCRERPVLVFYAVVSVYIGL